MATIEYKKLKIKQSYLGGMRFTDGASRKHSYELSVEGNKLFKDVFYSETHTKMINDFEWGKGKTTYYWDEKSKMFDTIIDLIKSKYKLKNIPIT